MSDETWETIERAEITLKLTLDAQADEKGHEWYVTVQLVTGQHSILLASGPHKTQEEASHWATEAQSYLRGSKIKIL